MSIELWALFGAGLVVFLSVLAQGLYLDLTSGVAYVLTSRETPPPSHGPLGGRLDRNVRNQIEGMAVFAPLVVVAALAGISNIWTQGAAVAFLASRVIFAPVYAFGLTPLRTVVWSVGFFALPVFAYGVLSEAAFRGGA